MLLVLCNIDFYFLCIIHKYIDCFDFLLQLKLINNINYLKHAGTFIQQRSVKDNFEMSQLFVKKSTKLN